MKPGMILGFAALLGLIAVIVAAVVMKIHPSQIRPPDADYDRVFKYCTNDFVRDDAKLASLRRDPFYAKLFNVQPGEYRAGENGSLYILGGGMFEIRLPTQLQVVRDFGGDMTSTTSSDRPTSIVGCTVEHMARALEVYNLPITALTPVAMKR